jgi:hypothetical protein
MSTVLLLVAGRACRRLLPLSTLLRLTVYFPDQAPSRFAVARRRYSPQVLRERVEAMRSRDEQLDGEHHHAALLLDLVAAINEHDHTTRGHSERVQAYAALIGRELGLSARDAAKLSWAALLHDVGRLRLQPGLLNKSGLPTDEEWEILSTHPAAGMELTEPLAPWLGPWMDAIGQHHERWDGGGYPRGPGRARALLWSAVRPRGRPGFPRGRARAAQGGRRARVGAVCSAWARVDATDAHGQLLRCEARGSGPRGGEPRAHNVERRPRQQLHVLISGHRQPPSRPPRPPLRLPLLAWVPPRTTDSLGWTRT